MNTVHFFDLIINFLLMGVSLESGPTEVVT